MLGIMRRYKQSILIKGVFTIIVLSFVGTIFLIWGEGGEGFKGSSGYAIKVNGEKIPYEEYQRAFERMKDSIQQIYGQPLTPEMEKQMGVRKMVVENLVTTALVRQEAKRMGIKVSDEDLVAAIALMPYFQKNGAFDKGQYEQVLKMNHITPAVFEEAKRQELLMEKARKAIVDKVTVSDDDLLKFYRKTRDRIDLQYTSFSPDEVRSAVKVTDQELNAYLQQHAKEFMTSEEIRLSYTLLTPDKAASGLKVSDEEIQTFYRKNIDRYQVKGTILPLDEVKDRVRADALKLKAVKQSYEAAADALNKNLKSADLGAAAHMLGTTVTDTPFFSAKAPPANIAGEAGLIQKAFLLKQGELGGPLETSRGVYLFKVTKRNPSVVPPLSSVRARVEKLVIDGKAADLARAKAEETLAKLAKGGFTGTLQETGSFSYSVKGEIPKIGVSRDIMEAATLLTTTAPVARTPLQANGRWYAIRLKSRVEAGMAEFQKEKEQLRQSLLPKKQNEALEAWLKGLKDKAKIVLNPALEQG
jgi:peptidyl-prolyl cis-trans isomerase D